MFAVKAKINVGQESGDNMMLEDFKLIGKETFYTVIAEYENNSLVETVCKSRRLAYHLMHSIKNNNRTCRGAYQKYQKRVRALNVSISEGVKVHMEVYPITPVERIDVNMKVG